MSFFKRFKIFTKKKNKVRQKKTSATDKFKIFLKGEKIAILGPKATGKTTLLTFLKENKLPDEYKRTDYDKYKGFVIEANGQKNYIKGGKDISGDESYKQYWNLLMKEAKYCFFLFNAHKVFNRNKHEINYLERNLEEAIQLAQKYKSKIFIIGNFTDQIKGFSNDDESIMRVLNNNLGHVAYKTQIQLNTIIWGHMMNKEGAEKLTKKIWARIKLEKDLK